MRNLKLILNKSITGSVSIYYLKIFTEIKCPYFSINDFPMLPKLYQSATVSFKKVHQLLKTSFLQVRNKDKDEQTCGNYGSSFVMKSAIIISIAHDYLFRYENMSGSAGDIEQLKCIGDNGAFFLEFSSSFFCESVNLILFRYYDKPN